MATSLRDRASARRSPPRRRCGTHSSRAPGSMRSRVGSETVLVDDPLLTARDVYRERPLVARRLRSTAAYCRPAARLLSTLSSGPVVIVTAAERRDGWRRPRRSPRRRAAFVACAPSRDLAMRCAAARSRRSESCWSRAAASCRRRSGTKALVDYVQLYEAPMRARPGWCTAAAAAALFSRTILIDRRVTQLGPDVLTEGYVHRPR